MAAPTIPPSDSDGAGAEEHRRRNVGWWITAAVAVSMVAMWIYVFGYHLGGNWADDTPGQMDDPAFAERAEGICAATLVRIDMLPKAFEAASPIDRADEVRATNTEFRTMLVELAAVPTATASDTTMIEEWLADWEIYLDDRDGFADRVATDPSARFYVTQSERDKRQVTVAFDRFALVNDMASCSSYDDLA